MSDKVYITITPPLAELFRPGMVVSYDAGLKGKVVFVSPNFLEVKPLNWFERIVEWIKETW
jgi:hypothetical protein